MKTNSLRTGLLVASVELGSVLEQHLHHSAITT